MAGREGNISLDDTGHIRVLPQDKYDEAEKTAFECNQFLSSAYAPTPFFRGLRF